MPRLASATSAMAMHQDPPPLLIGERCNAQGSKKFKQLLLEENYDVILEIAREQVGFGAHALDISTAVTERPDEAGLMHKVVKKLELGVEVPLVIDTTEVAVLEEALKTAPGRCLINSTHLEGGRAKADKIFALAKTYNAAVIVLTIDENGMAKTAERKLEVARRIYDLAVNEHGLRPDALVFDALTFTLATGDPEFANSAVETIAGIRLIKQALPGVLTSLGVSNLSFGLMARARPTLNSIMLYHCVQAGLDMAIINPAQVTPYADIPAEEKELAEDLIFNRHPDALQRFIEHFETAGAAPESTQPADPTGGMTPGQRLHWRILHRHKEGVEADIDEIINRSPTPDPSPDGRGEDRFLNSSPSPEGRGELPSPAGGRAGDEGRELFKFNPRLLERLKHLIRELRRNATTAEQLMWSILRNRAVLGAKFRRQHPVAGFILDFYCHEAKLAIELDGSPHLADEQVAYDQDRTKILEEHGIKVIRFWNSDVLDGTDDVVDTIWAVLNARLAPSPLPPLPSGEGEDASSPLVALSRGDGNSLPPSGEGSGMRASQHQIAVHILNTILLPAMQEVGDKFGAGLLILPFVLQSAEVMKKAVTHLENYLDKVEGVTKGTIVLATVYGDVHDIGKNLVKTILANNGYTVIDLGKQVPAETIINKATEVHATAIGLSALLVSTSRQMPFIVNELQRRGLRIPVLVGGAAINRRFGRRILFTDDGTAYEAGVFYCKDAFEGLERLGQLIDPQRKPALLEQTRKEADLEMGQPLQARARPAAGERSAIIPQPVRLPSGGTFGPKVVRAMPLELIFQHLNINELYRLSWGAKNAHGAEWTKLQAEFDSRLDSMKHAALKEGWLTPQAVYGFFPCLSDGDDLLIYHPESLNGKPELVTRFSFPRQPFDEHLCLADYFSPADSKQMDVVAFQVVTVGQAATQRFDKLQADGDYSEGYFIHGLAVQTAEATAEYLHQHIRRELGLPAGQGKRYSWGYPAIPELEDHRKVFDLLPAEKDLGMSLTSACQLVPEQSTAAIIVHHSQAKYYTTGESRVGQLLKQGPQ